MGTAVQEFSTREEFANYCEGCEERCECVQQQFRDASPSKYSSLLRSHCWGHIVVTDYVLIGIKLWEFIWALWRLC